MGKIAFLFAGQGAQHPGMGKALYEQSSAARRVFDLCESLRPGTLDQCFEASLEELSQTINTQPCLYAMDLACARAVEQAGIRPDGVAGFSLGEVAAAAFAGVMDEADGFSLVLHRARLMDDCVRRNPGVMAAVLRLTPDQVETICGGLNRVYPVNYNCPGQIVCAMDEKQLDAFTQAVTAARGRAIRLAVSGAFHSPFMEEAALNLEKVLRGMKLKLPNIPLFSNKTGREYDGDPAAALSAQVKSPVRWQATMEHMLAKGYDQFIEVGAGKTLTGLLAKIDKSVPCCPVSDPQGISALTQAEGRLSC